MTSASRPACVNLGTPLNISDRRRGGLDPAGIVRLSTMLAALVLATVAVAASPAAAAQRDGAGVRFPDVAQVDADYPDDAERFIAFDILFNTLGEATRGTRTPGAYALSSAYLRARGEVQDKYNKQGRDSEAYKSFIDRSGRLFSDPSFKRSVYEKYGLANLPAGGSGTSGGSAGGFVLFLNCPETGRMRKSRRRSSKRSPSGPQRRSG